MFDVILALERAGRPFWFITGAVSFCGVAILDYVTGAELSFSLFYLIPIVIFSWAVSGKAGALSAVISGLTWVTIEIITDNRSSNTFVYIWNAVIRLGFFLLPAILIRSLEQEKKHARTDYLTGALNNRYFNELMEREIDRSTRYKHPFTIAFIDLDNFKTVNDTFSHAFGDTILRTISESMKMNLRKTDIVARVGGDEFAILLPETDETAAHRAISKMLQKLSDELHEKKWPITFSIGVLTLTSPAISVDKILGITDKMMYVVKNNGKNNVKYASYTNK